MAANTPAEPAPRRKILIVDDTLTIRMLERAMLARDFEVVEAVDGEEAVRVALEQRPDLVLMDLMMPKKNGIHATREILARPEMRALPIIMVTTASHPESARDALLAGCCDYVVKPFSPTELMEKIRALLAP